MFKKSIAIIDDDPDLLNLFSVRHYKWVAILFLVLPILF